MAFILPHLPPVPRLNRTVTAGPASSVQPDGGESVFFAGRESEQPLLAALQRLNS